MTVKELHKLLADLPEDTEVYVRAEWGYQPVGGVKEQPNVDGLILCEKK